MPGRPCQGISTVGGIMKHIRQVTFKDAHTATAVQWLVVVRYFDGSEVIESYNVKSEAMRRARIIERNGRV